MLSPEKLAEKLQAERESLVKQVREASSVVEQVKAQHAALLGALQYCERTLALLEAPDAESESGPGAASAAAAAVAGADSRPSDAADGTKPTT